MEGLGGSVGLAWMHVALDCWSFGLQGLRVLVAHKLWECRGLRRLGNLKRWSCPPWDHAK